MKSTSNYGTLLKLFSEAFFTKRHCFRGSVWTSSDGYLKHLIQYADETKKTNAKKSLLFVHKLLQEISHHNVRTFHSPHTADSECVCVWKWIWLYLLYFLYLWSRVKPIYWHAMGCNITIANEHVFPKIMWIALIHGLKAIRQLTLNHHSLKKKNLAYWKTVAVFCVCDLLSMLMFSTFPAFNYVFVSQPSHSGIPLWPPCRISSILGIPLVYWWLDVWTFVLLANSLLK